jgi:outer membrane receptor protein involved in Fe transport
MKWLPRRPSLNIRAGVSNLLNRKDIRIRGNDQLRFDNDSKNPDLFPTKYTYGYGANYFVSCSLKF